LKKADIKRKDSCNYKPSMISDPFLFYSYAFVNIHSYQHFPFPIQFQHTIYSYIEKRRYDSIIPSYFILGSGVKQWL